MSVPSSLCVQITSWRIVISHLLLVLLWNFNLRASPMPFSHLYPLAGSPGEGGKCTAQNLGKIAAFWNKKMGGMG